MKRLLLFSLPLLLAGCMLSACTEKGASDASSDPVSPQAASSEESSAVESTSQTPSEAVMAYEIPNNFNDAYTDTFGVTDLKDMQIECKQDVYNIRYNYGDGASYLTSLVRKRWGVWMLGTMEYTGADGKKATIITPSTDYEWVLNCGPTPSSVTFRGGNHGDYVKGSDWDASNTAHTNDHLIDMTFYDAQTGEKVELEQGETKTVRGLRVVIHTNIYDGEYKPENVLVSVEKIYLFNGEDVLLDSYLNIVKTTYFTYTYSCMMPISKQYGNCVKFYNDDGTETLVKTPLSSTKGGFAEKNKACKAELWGEEQPAYHMTVTIHNPKDQFYHSSLYARLWNINASQNKLYFSMFSDTPDPVRKGTSWNFKNSWSFSYQPDFVSPETADVSLGF